MKILIMDDSATARALFKACFRNKPNYEIIEAKQINEALEKAKMNQMDLIVLDYNMPDLTGSEVAQIMKKNGVKGQFVLLTANTQQSVIDEAKALGFLDVIEKPISPESIDSLLARLT
ncbi:sensory box histidine kinase/response regulator [Legionella busanensis]|uniref:Sensory box histidine kinase/response regulator n=1 Tax=Legionella busanensis TaxID=190655 RepID=A0A378JI80_9GAMM|nr:response regulator [Legionella busanensis]STX49960.1 sensory box histidine kinase/response regulator [Legionella busanensis]